MRLLVIGGSDAGISVGLRARELDPSVEVTLLVADAYPNFSICGLPYYLSGDVGDWWSLPTKPFTLLWWNPPPESNRRPHPHHRCAEVPPLRRRSASPRR